MAKKIEILENTLLKLLVRRGSNQDRIGVTLSEGELGYTTDTNRLYVGDGSTEGGILVGNKFLGQDNEITTFTEANIGDLAYDSNDRALYAYMGPGPASAIENWQLISSVTDEGTGNINVGINQIRPDAAGAGIVVTGGQLAIDCNGIKTNKVEACAGVMQLPNKIQFGAGGSSYEYTLPARTNSAGKFLVGDNNGNLSWSNDVASDVITYFNSNDVPVPVGTIAPFASLDAVMNNWVICDGSSKSTTAYPDLFDVIGYNYGGSGGTFNVPNLINKTIYGTTADPSGELEYGLGGEGGEGGGVSFGTEWTKVTRNFTGHNQWGWLQVGNISQIPTYTNDTGNYLAIIVNSTTSGQYDEAILKVIVGDVVFQQGVDSRPTNNYVSLIYENNSDGATMFGRGSIIVPPGEKYTFVQESTTNSRINTIEVMELRGPAGGGGSTGLSNAEDILNIYGGGQGTAGAFGVTNSIPEGSYLVDVNWIENGGSTDEDTVLTVSQKFNIPTGNYLHFANSGINGFYAITTSQTAPVEGSGDWINVNTLTGFKGGSDGNSNTAVINGFAIKLNATETTGTAPIDAKAMVYAIKAVGDPIVDSTMTVRSPLTAAVDGVQQGENPFNPLSNNIEIGMPVVESSRMLAGSVNADGTVNTGTGFTAVKNSTGRYTVTLPTAGAGKVWILTANAHSVETNGSLWYTASFEPHTVEFVYVNNNTIQLNVKIGNYNGGWVAQYQDAMVNFIAIESDQ